MKPTIHHYSASLIATGIFFVSVFAYIFIYYSVYNQAAKTGAANVAVVTEQGAAASERSVMDSLAATADERALLGTYLISPNATVPFIERIEAIGPQTGSRTSIVSISDDSGVLSAHVSIDGSWKSVMQAMHLIENVPFALSMDNVKMTLTARGEWNENFDISIPSASSTPQ